MAEVKGRIPSIVSKKEMLDRYQRWIDQKEVAYAALVDGDPNNGRAKAAQKIEIDIHTADSATNRLMLYPLPYLTRAMAVALHTYSRLSAEKLFNFSIEEAIETQPHYELRIAGRF